jgi:ABC-type molybdate transport system permease subunit
MPEMSKQLALSIAVSVMAMICFVLLGQQAGVQLARDARSQVPLSADYAPLPSLPRFLPILN